MKTDPNPPPAAQVESAGDFYCKLFDAPAGFERLASDVIQEIRARDASIRADERRKIIHALQYEWTEEPVDVRYRFVRLLATKEPA